LSDPTQSIMLRAVVGFKESTDQLQLAVWHKASSGAAIDRG